MKIKTKVILLDVAFILGVFAIGEMIFSVSVWFAILFFLLPLGANWYVMRWKCPSCNRSIMDRPVHFLGIEFSVATLRVPRRCNRCGYDLNDKA